MSYIGNTPTTQAFTPAVDYFSGNGSTTAFTLSRPVASVAQVEAVIDNVGQNPSGAYTVSGNPITFTSAPLAGTNNIYVRYTSPITQVIAPSAGTVGSSQLASLSTIPTTGGNIAIPAVTGTMMVSGNMPAFSYYQSVSQSLSSATVTKLTFTSSEFDTTGGMYANSRFTPTVAGYYQVNAAVRIQGSSGVGENLLYVFKNGAAWKRSWNMSGTVYAATFWQMSISVLVYLNGSTDNIEIYALQGSGISLNTQVNSDITYFQAVMVRAA